jgi:hypothetical protein
VHDPGNLFTRLVNSIDQRNRDQVQQIAQEMDEVTIDAVEVDFANQGNTRDISKVHMIPSVLFRLTIGVKLRVLIT